jgi:Fur family transcriptional regulator, zinc uptake regulator
MKHIEGIIRHAEQHCKARGARLTVKRKQVLAGLIQSDKALSAYELIDFCKEQYGESIPAMSVYRILEFLENELLVHKLNLANKYVACAHISCDHAHDVPQFLICGKCSKVKEISVKPSTIADLQITVQEAGFKLISPQLEMNCLCNDCLAQVALQSRENIQ